ncbi:MAG TPA: ABC transporter permease subunit [Candidatus Methylacidiphilales bacterium]|jgi:NitT/TauT family transport system permease protein|nr:ABC transporter permease subunit [Candidatus Methylacidiphilales bacterium]
MDLNPAQRQQAPEPPRRSFGADLFVLAAIIAGLFSLIAMGKEMHQPFQNKVEINLSPWMLPYYTMLSFLRGAGAYVLSFLFTLWYARWAAYDRRAERFLIPLLDILQSIPLAAFLTPIEIFLVGLFPHSEMGLELTCVIVIFTGQVWNMTFSFYYSLKALPDDFNFVGKLARFTGWQKFTQIELPFATKGLVYNSMVSMAGGWFFLSIIEAFQLGDQDYRVPGIGSYMSVAKEQNNGWAQVYAVVAMIVMIVAIDQLIWRPLIVWSNKFKIEDTEAEYQDRSAVLRFFSRSRVVAWFGGIFNRLVMRPAPVKLDAAPVVVARKPSMISSVFPWRKIFFILTLLLIGWGAWNVFHLLWEVAFSEWLTIGRDLLLTLVRVLCAVGLSTLIAVPIGVWIGSNPKLAQYMMPLTQIAASFPSPLVFSNLFFLIVLVGGNLQWGSVILMMLGTIWYILFNVISGASAIPQDLRACTQLTHLKGWQRWRTLWLPGIFPALTTGWITAAGGAWNASIVSEYLQDHNPPLQATGLGAFISNAQANGDFPGLAAAVLAMALFVVFFNRFVWKRLSAIAQERYQFLT